MTTRSHNWIATVALIDHDLAEMYLQARCAGVPVFHQKDLDCSVFDSRAGEFGLFRRFGIVSFNKDTRRWSATARTDANSAEVATLIERACRQKARYGSQPGQGLRAKVWTHHTVRGERYATLSLARRVDPFELITTVAFASVPDTVDELLTIKVDA